MSTAVAARRYTPEEYLALPDFDRYELVDGELVEVHMSALSSWVGGEVYGQIREHCRSNDLGWVWPADNIVRCFADPNRFRKPDVSFIRRDRLSWGQLDVGVITIPPDLVVEVIAPNDLADDLDERINDYLGAGVPLVWVVNPEPRTVRVFRSNGTYASLTERDELNGEDVLPGFRCPVAAIFPPKAEAPPARG